MGNQLNINKFDLEVNAGKREYIYMSRHQSAGQLTNLKIPNMSLKM
jgi:hypothetical protein